MRSDFYSLPWAAQQAIRRGEREARTARARAYTVAELEAKVAELEAALEEARTASTPRVTGDDVVERALAPFMVRGLENCSAAWDYPLMPEKERQRIRTAANAVRAAIAALSASPLMGSETKETNS
jgi:hypothetical protein